MKQSIQTKYILLITGIDNTKRLKIAIAFAMVLRSRGIMSLLTLDGDSVGAKKKMEEFGYEVVAVGDGKTSGGLAEKLFGSFKHKSKVKNAEKLLKLKAVNGVITMGGGSGTPYVEAAKNIGVKAFLQEANAVLSPANIKVVDIVDKVFLSFKELGSGMDPKKVVATGTPVEKRLVTAEPRNIPTDKKIMVVFKCEKHSNSMNDLIRSMFTKYPEMRREFFVLQETGEKDVASVKRFYDSVQVESLCYMSYENRGKYYQTADVILCRPTCDVIGELVALKKPGVLLPLPPKMDLYQKENAKLMGKSRLAYIVEDTGSMAIRTKKLYRALSAFLDNPEQLKPNCEALDFLGSASRMANNIERCLSGK
jgi:UDP-N-acetylglucosamine--N-acetylmuramyl-(pentapeptide) pyrophosphoryl-undecaprenol N-acetylglucosamine transferase